MNSTAKILYDAADLIDQHGWTQGENRSSDGCLCMIGAIHAALPRKDKAAIHDPFDVVRIELGTWKIATWNDTKGRTVDQVTTALRNAAQTEEGTA